MIINSIFSLIFLWSLKQYSYRLRKLQNTRKNISRLPIYSVTEAISKLQKAEPGSKIFLIVKGLVKLRIKLRGQKSIYSFIDLKEIRRGRLSQHLMRRSWEDLAKSASWKQPHNIHNLSFTLEDSLNSNSSILVRSCKQSALSGAINEIFQDHNVRVPSSNIFVRTLLKLHNFLANRAPFCYILSPSVIGEELGLYGVQNGQFSLVIGNFQKQLDGRFVCNSPKFVSKQRSYVEIKMQKNQKKYVLICFLLASLIVILGIKFLRKAYEKYKKWRIQRVNEDYDQPRSETEGDNCNCIICYQRVRNIVFKPCLHYAVCKSCFKLMPRKNCPYCKEQIEDTIQIVKRR